MPYMSERVESREEGERVSARRGWGEGSVHRRKGGGWAAILSMGTRTERDGREHRVRKTVYGRTKAEALAKLHALRVEHPTTGRGFDEDLTLKDWIERWLREVATNNVRASTLENYERDVRKHIIPQLGRVPLRRLTPSAIAEFYRDLATSGTPASSIRAVHLRLHSALEAACDLELISRNPAGRLAKVLPKTADESRRSMDVAQVRQFLSAAQADRLYSMYVLAIYTGLRQGELFALRWSDLDLDAGKLTVSGTLKVTKGKTYVDAPKTRRGRRTVSLPAAPIAALRRHRPAEADASAWIFTDADGGPLRRANVTGRSFRPILKRAGLPVFKFHELRHTHASLLAAVPGLHPKVVQERLGHASIDMTLDTYSHLFEGADAGVVAGLDALDLTDTREQ
jgi:integrase